MKRKQVIACIIGAVALAAVLAAGGIYLHIRNAAQDAQTVYKETTVAYGDLTVGITEESTVDIGTLEQDFSLDISALVQDSSDSSSSGNTGFAMMSGPGGNSFSQIFSFAEGGNSYGSSEQSMEVESVQVQTGQEVSAGDVLYTLTQDSVDDIKDRLESDVNDAAEDLSTVQLDQSADRLSARQTYESALAYGDYAGVEYNLKLNELQEKVEDAQESLDDANEELESLQSKLLELQTQYQKAKENFQEVEYGLQQQDKETNLYGYLTQKSFCDQARTTMESLESQVETQTDKVESQLETITQLESALKEAQRDYDTGALEAKENYDLRNLAYDTAKETYSIAISYLDTDVSSLQRTYDNAVEKLEKFNSYVVDNTVVSEYDGVVTEVSLSAGDTITTNTPLLTLYDADKVTMSVDVDESDIDEIAKGDEVNITLTAYPEEVLTGIVTDIDDAEVDSDGNVTYPVTVTIQGDVNGLYQGMTGDVTFITKETKQVCYVSNRAIFREGIRSYVKCRDENSKIVEKDVTTGFSDGVNVEIIDGLSEGDVVLIESKVSD